MSCENCHKRDESGFCTGNCAECMNCHELFSQSELNKESQCEKCEEDESNG
jgi:hypothetical protein